MNDQWTRFWRWCYRPWPLGLLVAVLSGLLLLNGAWHLGSWQARQAEQQRLGVLHEDVVRRTSGLFSELAGHLQTLGQQRIERCDENARQQLRTLRRGMLYVQAVAVRMADGQWCQSLPLPDEQSLQAYQAWQFDSVRLWWSPQQLNASSEPSLMLQSERVQLASSLRYFQDVIALPEGYQALLTDAQGQRMLDYSGLRSATTAAEQAAAHSPQLLSVAGQHVYLRGPGDKNGIRLLLVADDSRLQEATRYYQRLFSVVALLFSVLTGWLAALLIRHEQSLEKALSLALRRGELEVDYQPLVDLQTRRCVGAEALVRWRRADGQRVRPDLFIPQAEDSGQICAITQRVIELVLAEVGELLRSNPQLYVSVNLAAADIAGAAFVEPARRLLREAGVAPAQLVWEVTERGLVDVELATRLLGQLRADGHRIAIDDFGTGYSSLSYLQQLPVDVLKIDKSFVDALGTEAASSPVAPHVIEMAHDLGLKVIAEGVEHDRQAGLLAELGAQIGQGWLFAKPLNAQAFRTFVEQH